MQEMTEKEKAVARVKARRMESYERNRIPEMVLLLLAISYILDAI